jgi:hypothetical protein
MEIEHAASARALNASATTRPGLIAPARSRNPSRWAFEGIIIAACAGIVKGGHIGLESVKFA